MEDTHHYWNRLKSSRRRIEDEKSTEDDMQAPALEALDGVRR